MNRIIQNVKIIYLRFKSQTPRFFKTIRNVCLFIAMMSAFIISLESGGVKLPEWLKDILNNTTVVMGLLISFIAQLTTKFDDYLQNASKIEEELKLNNNASKVEEELKDIDKDESDIGGGNTGTIKP